MSYPPPTPHKYHAKMAEVDVSSVASLEDSLVSVNDSEQVPNRKGGNTNKRIENAAIARAEKMKHSRSHKNSTEHASWSVCSLNASGNHGCMHHPQGTPLGDLLE